MKKKGISAIIATLLLLVITIGLAMTAYFYINNMVQRSTSKVVTVEPGYCSSNNNVYTITLVITNTGTESIQSGDLKYTLNSGVVTNLALTGGSSYPISPRSTVVASISNANAGINNLIIITPSGSIRQQVFC
ncbi:MAG: archaellin/type IV pilin N-terminal domain-containing protein [Candidatus Aenigmatarchaeota archaeon]